MYRAKPPVTVASTKFDKLVNQHKKRPNEARNVFESLIHFHIMIFDVQQSIGMVHLSVADVLKSQNKT